MNLRKAPPGKLNALKAMMGGGGGPDSPPPEAQGEGDVMGPEAAPEGGSMPEGGGDVDAQMNEVLDSISAASATLGSMKPQEEQDASALAQAKQLLDQALELINSTAHPEQGQPSDQEPTAEESGSQMSQQSGEL